MFELQTHVNHLAKTYCQDRVKQARSYLRSIFDEAIEQEFLVKDPTRKLRIPRNLRPKGKRILTWDQLRAALAKATRRNRLILLPDMTDASRPSELFAIRWRAFGERFALWEDPKSLGKIIFQMILQPSYGNGKWSAQTPHRTRRCPPTRTANSWTHPTTGIGF
jgi:integrase